MKTRDVLKRLGFAEDPKLITDEPPGYRFSAKFLEIEASEQTNMYLRRVFQLSGSYANGRTLADISFQMPVEVESFEQGVAFVAHAVGNVESDQPPPWLSQGRQWAGLLPWRRKAGD